MATQLWIHLGYTVVAAENMDNFISFTVSRSGCPLDEVGETNVGIAVEGGTYMDAKISHRTCTPALDENCKIEGPFSIETAPYYFLELRHHGGPRHRFTGNVNFGRLEKTSHLVYRFHWPILGCTPHAPLEH